MKHTKLDETLRSQKDQLTSFQQKKETLEAQLKAVSEGILQLKGSIAALEFVAGLEDEKPEPEKENPLKAVK